MTVAFRSSPGSVANREEPVRVLRWRARLAAWTPWLLLESLIATAFMAAHVALAIVDAGHEVASDTIVRGLASGAVFGGIVLAIAAFGVAMVTGAAELVMALLLRLRHPGRPCPDCRYDLRGHAPESICPECGSLVLPGARSHAGRSDREPRSDSRHRGDPDV